MASIKYFGPGGQSVTLGSESDKWAGVNATDASIDSFKSKGNSTTPVYFDENGVPQAVTSSMEDTELKQEVASIKTAVEGITNGTSAAGSAEKLSIARTISLTGDATGSASFDGSGDVSIDVTVSGGASGKTDDFFTVNDDWFLVPSENPTTSNSFQLDSNGFITIKEA